MDMTLLFSTVFIVVFVIQMLFLGYQLTAKWKLENFFFLLHMLVPLIKCL